MTGVGVNGSDDAAFLAGLLREFALLAQPEGNAGETKYDDPDIEGVAQWDQHGLEGPFNELADGGDEVLEIHGFALLARK